MTCKEKWLQLNPGRSADEIEKKKMCVVARNIMSVPAEYCDKMFESHNCSKCWDQEIPETNELMGEAAIKLADSALKTGEAIQNAAKAMVNNISTIKDSGDRTQFETGAVRDMHEGKGRCDLLPLEVVAEIYHKFSDEDPDVSRLFDHIANFKRSNNTDYLYQALDDCDVFPGWETMLLEVAKHFEEGAKKYDENNWQKGIPVKCYIDSGIRHYLKWLRGDKDEPHDRAFVWNIMCCIWEVDYSPRAEKKDNSFA